MYLITQQERTVPPHLAGHRTESPLRRPSMLAVTDRGTGQIMTLSREGISFGCLYPHVFPKEWTLDILDDQSGHVRELRVRKIWEMNRYYFDYDKRFELVIGAEFIDLTDQQAIELETLLENTVNLEPVYRS